jgi:hypothetical protein
MMAAPTKGMKAASIMRTPQSTGAGIPTIQKATAPSAPCTAATAKLLSTLAKRTFSMMASSRSRYSGSIGSTARTSRMRAGPSRNR